MVGEIFAGLQAFKTLLDGAKALAEMRDEGIRLQASIELQRQINAAEQNYAAALQRIRTLEAELMECINRRADLERYELHDIGGGAVAYMLKPAERGAEPPHWLCPACYAEGKKSVLQFSSRFSQGRVYRRGQCKAHVTTRSIPAWER